MLQNLTVDLNKLVKVRFSDGDELLIRLFDKTSYQTSNELPVNKEAPLAKALLGHSRGEQIIYQVRNNTYKVTILEIYSN